MGTKLKLTGKIKASLGAAGMYITGTVVAVSNGITFNQYPQISAAASPSPRAASLSFTMAADNLTAQVAVVSTSHGFSPSNFAFGVNLHSGGTSTAQNVAIASVLQSRNLLKVRFDLFYDQLPNALTLDLAQRVVAQGGSVQGIILGPAQFDNVIKTSAQSLSAWEALHYSTTNALVNQYKTVITDFELLNEADLRSEITAQVGQNVQTSQAAVSGHTAFISIGRALKGMSRAISDIRASSGTALRIIMGTTGRDWGFLSYMETLGVGFDMVGWHNYPALSYAPLNSDTFFGPSGAMERLRSFNRPFTINEWNSNEIYNGGYTDTAGNAIVEQGYSGITIKTREQYQLTQVTSAPLDSIVFYEMLNEPSKAAPENHFGLMYSVGAAKVPLYIVTAFAGGTLTTAETVEITSRGLMSAGEINAMKHV